MLIEFIRENWDIFAWKPSDMPGVPRELAEHTLNIDPKFKPVKQFLRRFNEERRKAIAEEVARLLAAGFIIEVFTLSGWLIRCSFLTKMALGVSVWTTQI